MSWIAIALFGLAAFPAGLTLWNFALYRRTKRLAPRNASAVSILIPARDEERVIEATVRAAAATRGVPFEVVVMDDSSRDGTREIVQALSAEDPRIRLEQAPPLPDGWNGKQHACRSLANVARYDHLVFVDADVRLDPDAAARMVRFLEDSGTDLASGVPRQVTGTWLERMMIPLIQFVLLGYLPMFAMRRTNRVEYAAGCGQLMIARREAYEAVDGHAAIRESRHDGIALPRAFRTAGHRTDLFDATDLATCRMYRSAREVRDGLAKNATEGMASPVSIVPWSIVLLGGQVAPILWLPATWAMVAIAVTVGTRAVLAVRFHQSWFGVMLHPVSIVLLVAIQWYALVRERFGVRTAWKGRTQT